MKNTSKEAEVQRLQDSKVIIEEKVKVVVAEVQRLQDAKVI
jgi:hypothetical protein